VTGPLQNFSGYRVTHVLYSGLGGHSAMLFALLDAGFMQGAGHDVLFIGVEPPPDEYLHRCAKIQVSWRYVPKLPGRGHLRFLLAVCRQLVANNPNVIFMHGLAAMPSTALVKLFRFGSYPFVMVRETQANHLKSRHDWISLILAHWIAHSIVHLTTEAADGSARKLGCIIQPKKISVIPNGLDTEYFSPRNKNAHDDGMVHIGMQSRLQPNKDHETLIKAFYFICQRYPQKHIHLHIAGDGSTYQAIRQMISELGLSKKTTLHGMIAYADLRDFLNGLDIYVHCTHGETMSTAIMQALSCGLPVIASNVAGVSNMVQPDAGMLYRPGDPNDLVEKLDKLIANPGDMDKWRQRARNYAVKYYAITATVDAYEKLISSSMLFQ